MKYELYSYRFAEEIIKYPRYACAWNEITSVIAQAPLFIYPNKSKNKRLDIVQQVMNTYYDRVLSVEHEWEYHPLATSIENSRLAADFRKCFSDPPLTIQVEVQFGNMARFYSDIFKFQTAYSQNLIDMGLCIVPMSSMANRIDSNVTNYERIIRELPSAKMSITLPILIIGIYTDAETNIIDISQTHFKNINDITGSGKTENRYKIVNGYLQGIPMDAISSESETGSIAKSLHQTDEDD